MPRKRKVSTKPKSSDSQQPNPADSEYVMYVRVLPFFGLDTDLINKLSSDVASNGSDVTSNDTDVTSNDTDVATNDTDVTSNDTDVNMASSSSSNVIDTNNVRQLPTCYSQLPEAVMSNILKCLPLKDLMSVQKVCKSWQSFTEDSSSWKHVPVDISLLGPWISPYVHTIMGLGYSTDDEFWTWLMTYMKDLKVLNAEFINPLNAESAELLINKFPKLESINIQLETPNLVDVLAALQHSSNLTELKFLCGHDYPLTVRFLCKNELCEINLRNVSSEVCHMIGDNFKALTSLDFVHLLNVKFNHTDILYLLEHKLGQLKFLRFHCWEDTNLDILKTVCRSEQLEHFCLGFSLCLGWPPVCGQDFRPSVDFSQMANLKFLEIYSVERCVETITPELMFPSSLEVLKMSFVCPKGTLPILIESCPNLKHLELKDVLDENVDEQLESISTLSNLHTLFIDEWYDLSTRGIENISKCQTLRRLKFRKMRFDNDAFPFIGRLKYLQKLKFESCEFNPINLSATISALKYLTYLRVSYPRVLQSKFSKRVLRNIIRNCKAEKHVVKIDWKMYSDVERKLVVEMV